MPLFNCRFEAILNTLLLTADMEKLEVLDLEGNKVDDLGALVYLGWCPQLAVLTLADNPVAQEPAYGAQVFMHHAFLHPMPAGLPPCCACVRSTHLHVERSHSSQRPAAY